MQAADEAMAERVDILRLYGLPYFWGFRHLVFAGSPADKSVNIKSLEAVFPSGAAVNVPYDASLAPLALGPDWPAPDKPGLLYLGLALPQAGGANAAPEQGGVFSGARYVYAEEPENLPDLYGDAPPAPVRRLKYAPLLIRDVDLERYPGFELMPLASLRRRGEAVEFDDQFLPPLMCLEASGRLTGLVRRVRDAALSCAGRLAGYKSPASGEAPDIRFILNFSALGVVNRHVPWLTHLLAAPNTHPWHVYGALRVFAGELSSFFDNMDCLGRAEAEAEGLPDYTHDEPQTCFNPLCALLTKLLADIGHDESRILPLLPEPPYFAAAIPDNFISTSCRYWLCIKTESMNEDLAESFPRFAKLGARDRLNLIIAKAVSGVPLARLAGTPPGFLKRKDSAWYSVDTAHPLWRSIVEQGRVSLFWEGAPEGAEARLVATGL
jgi:type VI secretion system protein ImpJ